MSFATSRWLMPALGKPRAIDVQAQFGRGDILVQMHVHGAGNLGHAVANGARDFEIRGLVVAGDADVDRRLEAEVQDLADDVGGLKVEGEIGKFLPSGACADRRRKRARFSSARA